MMVAVRERARAILCTEDSPSKIALGFAIGVLVAWTPTIGIQMIVAGMLAWMLRGNVAAAVAIVWISNPYTALPIYYSNYLLGYYCMGGEWLDWNWFAELLTQGNRTRWEYVQFAYHKLGTVLGPMFVGSLVVGVPLAIVSYFATFYAVREHRRRRGPRSSGKGPMQSGIISKPA